jgi:hypothetical protein
MWWIIGAVGVAGAAFLYVLFLSEMFSDGDE